MARISDVIPNLINGVSQQPFQLRLPTQAQAQENAMSSVTDGLSNRPPTGHLALILNSLDENAFVHFINRDEVERYVVVVEDDGVVRVFDFAGNEKTVTGTTAYLTTSNPKEDIRAVTVADYTFLLNRTKVVEMDTTTADTRPYEALVNVQVGNYGKVYRILINGNTAGVITAADGDVASDSELIDTVYLAEALETQLIANGFNTSPWSVKRYGNALYIKNTSTDFSIGVEDGFNGNAMKAAKGVIQKFTDLPVFGPHGFVVEIAGDPASDFDNYWVKFSKQDGDSNYSYGVWEECPEPGVEIRYKASTMPHTLIRQAGGTFTYGAATWNDRLIGNEALAPPASFVGKSINDLFFHKNRLGFLADENVIMSRSGDFFNFWRGTLTTILDDDPIDVATTHTRVSIMERAVPFDGRLVIFSNNTQFELSSDDALSPVTVSLTPKANFENDAEYCPPIATGSFIYFVNRRGDYGAVYEFRKDALDNVYKANDATAHAPKYVPDRINHIVASSAVETLIARTDGENDTLYPYKFYWAGEEKLQASWSKWSFPGVTFIYGIEIVDTDLLMLVKRSDGKAYLEWLSLAPGAVDESTTYLTRLDRKVSSADMVAGSYSAVNDQTTYTLPYSLSATEDDYLVVCSREVSGGAYPPGLKFNIVSVSGSTVVVDGDTTAYPLWFGLYYTMSYTFSPFYVRDANPNGGQSVVSEGRLQLHYLTLEYANTGYFRVVVSVQNRESKTYIFNNASSGATNPISLATGKFRVPILSRNDQVTITIESDSYLPCSILSAEWSGQFVMRTRRIG